MQVRSHVIADRRWSATRCSTSGARVCGSVHVFVRGNKVIQRKEQSMSRKDVE